MPQQHPKPFSSAWMTTETPPPATPRGEAMAKRVLRFFERFPRERPLALLTVFVLVTASLWLGGPSSDESNVVEAPLVAQVPDSPQIQFTEPRPTVEPDISTDSLQVTDGSGEGTPADSQLLNLQPETPEEEPTTPGGILPDNRILAFYGFPGNPEMGILGEYDMQRLLELLSEQAAAYEEADPSHPVVMAFEVIASVAQQYPQSDGSYLLDTPTDVLNDYAEFTRDNGLLLILDVQIGYRTVEQDVTGLRPWLVQDHVHLAIDPEFAMDEGQIPGDVFGSVDATDVRWAQQYLIDLAVEAGVGPKVLIVHQFIETMITHKDQIVPMRGVQLVLDADGWGPPDQKRATYDFVNRHTGIEYAGVKLFYVRDNPLMTPEEILSLDPVPLYIQYA